MPDHTLYTCDLCEGTVRPVTGPGRTYGFCRTTAVPENFVIMTCDLCRTQYMSVEELEALAREAKNA